MTVTTAPLTTAWTLSWVSGLAEHGTRTALHTDAGAVTYADLAGRVQELAARLGGARRLVLVEGGATVETVVAYLAALDAGHVVLLAGAGEPSARQRETYGPDIVLGPSGSVDILRQQSAHELHPDLVLLLSTSGSTGSSKLVRLSAENLAANAWQIDEALGVRADDCAALTLPLTYTYGLSVLNTHLARGAAVVLTERSVVDECFWRLFGEAGASTFPGVPHTFEMLERSGFADRHLPHLRYVTQAGGRMDPERVRHWAALGRERGWDFIVMYGQSEATARMAYLPPHLTASHPHTVGVAVPGAAIRIEDGEVVFRGPNVMLGYATEPADLALGRTVDELRTGDLGRLTPEGLLELVGRRARFVKVLGHRVDLDTLERRLRAEGDDVRCGGRDGLVVVSVRGTASAPAREALRRRAIRAGGVPREALRVVSVTDHPTLASGKPDYGAVLALGDAAAARDGGVGASTAAPSVAGLFSHLLQREVDDDATFVALGGDSLSYVEVSIRLEELLGHLPPSWHITPVRELERLRAPAGRESPEKHGRDDGNRRQGTARGAASAARHVAVLRPRTWREPSWRTMESSVWLRALATMLIVGTHADLFSLQGTANALLVIAGYQI
ncbi:MAG TPA: non-ribosomal peptide synthetase, partial [Dermatophilaceae bacterium]|nr:non-ribosomal peptide synthetase [Dermatophilaceae bacterium]